MGGLNVQRSPEGGPIIAGLANQMTSVAPGQSAKTLPADVDASALPAWLTPARIVMGAAVGLAWLALFHDWFWFQNQFSWGSRDWAHAYVIPLISGYAIWQRREEFRRLRPTVFWPGLLPVLAGVGAYFFFVLGFANHMGKGISLVLTLFGLALLHLGPRAMALLAFPIGYLLFGVTISGGVMQPLTFQLQDIAADGSWFLLNTIGVTTEMAGNTLTVIGGADKEIPLNIAEACSGLRLVVAFYALATAVAFLSCEHWWQRIALLLLAGPIAVLVNVIRVTSLGVAVLWNPELAQGQAHMFIGVLWLVPAFLVFMGVVWLLKRIVVHPALASESAMAKEPSA